jgi:hypothetical protein
MGRGASKVVGSHAEHGNQANQPKKVPKVS